MGLGAALVIVQLLACYYPANARPAYVDWSAYADIHPGLPRILQVRAKGARCGTWQRAYAEMHAAARPPHGSGRQHGSSNTQKLRAPCQAAEELAHPDSKAVPEPHSSNTTVTTRSDGGSTSSFRRSRYKSRAGGGGRHTIANSSSLIGGIRLGGSYAGDDSAALLSGHPPGHRFAVMVSNASGLADRLTCSLSVFLYALVTNRSYEYVWYGNHELWGSLRSVWIDWRPPALRPAQQRARQQLQRQQKQQQQQLSNTANATDLGGGSSSDVSASYVGEKGPHRLLRASFYLPPGDMEGIRNVQRLYDSDELLSYGNGHDIVAWTLNVGLLGRAFRGSSSLTNNSNGNSSTAILLEDDAHRSGSDARSIRLRGSSSSSSALADAGGAPGGSRKARLLHRLVGELGLSWPRVVPCLFNFLYTPAPAALRPLARTPGLLDKLLDPRSIIIGIQIRAGDWVFRTDRWLLPEDWGMSFFDCAQQLTIEILRNYEAKQVNARNEQRQQQQQRQNLQEQQQLPAAGRRLHTASRYSHQQQLLQTAAMQGPGLRGAGRVAAQDPGGTWSAMNGTSDPHVHVVSPPTRAVLARRRAARDAAEGSSKGGVRGSALRGMVQRQRQGQQGIGRGLSQDRAGKGHESGSAGDEGEGDGDWAQGLGLEDAWASWRQEGYEDWLSAKREWQQEEHGKWLAWKEREGERRRRAELEQEQEQERGLRGEQQQGAAAQHWNEDIWEGHAGSGGAGGGQGGLGAEWEAWQQDGMQDWRKAKEEWQKEQHRMWVQQREREQRQQDPAEAGAGDNAAKDGSGGGGSESDAGGGDDDGAPRIYWLVLSDSWEVRRRAKAWFPSRVLVADQLALEHVQDHSHNGQEGLHAAAGELWLFGLAHIHVITRESHFGRLGALAGGRYGSTPRVYSLAKPYDRRSCRLAKPDSVDELSTHWAGLR